MGKGAGEIGDLSQHLARACIHTLLVDFLMLKKTLPSIEDPVLPQGARERERDYAGERGEKIYNGCPQHDHVIEILWSVSNSVIMCNGIK